MQHYFDPDSPAQKAITRQDITYSAHRALEAFRQAQGFACSLEECIRWRVWERPRTLASGGSSIAPMSFHDFIHLPYPEGLGVNYAECERVISIATFSNALRHVQRAGFNPERMAALAKDWKDLTGRSIEL